MAFIVKKQAGLHTINVATTDVFYLNNARSDYIAIVGPILGANFSNHQRFVKLVIPPSYTLYGGGGGAFISNYNGFWKLVYDDGYNTIDVIGDPASTNPNFILPIWYDGLDGDITITTSLDLKIKKNTTFKISKPTPPFYTPSLSIYETLSPGGWDMCYGGWRVHFDPRDVGKNGSFIIEINMSGGDFATPITITTDSFNQIPSTFDIQNDIGGYSIYNVIARLIVMDVNDMVIYTTPWSDILIYDRQGCN
jgi:hypothetical protein